MIILDTNVISEVMLPRPAPRVTEWIEALPAADLATTTICVAEIRYGLARLPFGRRRQGMETVFNGLLRRAFPRRVFGFDGDAADAFAELAASRERSGRPFRDFDGLIAAIAASRGLAVATRDVRGFDGCGLKIINPWEPESA